MKFRKTIAAVTAVMMCVSVLGVPVFAENNVSVGAGNMELAVNDPNKPEVTFPDMTDDEDFTEADKDVTFVKSGECGATATWGLTSDGTLYITGTGAMDNYYYDSDQPWYKDPNIITDDPDIKRVVIGSGITAIGEAAFFNISTLETVSLPEGGALQVIGASAFEACTSLTKINFPYGLTKIESCALNKCTSIKSITLPDSISYVGSNAFCYCSNLERISIPVVNVNYDCKNYYELPFYYGCSSLKYCTLTGKGDMKGSEYFSPIQYTNITTLTISDTITSLYSDLAYECYNLKTVTLPNGIKSIPYRAFYQCSLLSISIPNSVTTIGESAFYCNDFTSVILPENITSIGEYAFSFCTNLSTLVIPKSLTSIGNNAFLNCPQLKHIHIPDGRTPAQYVNTPLPSNTSYYYHFNADGSCPAGSSCPIAYELAQQNRKKNAEAFVERLYVNLLGRASDPTGKANHVNRILSGLSACDVAKGFVLSTELANKKLSNKEFVTRMYKTMLDRNPDATGLARWTAALDNGCSYGYVLQGFGKSAEFTRLCSSYGITRGSYTSPENRDQNEKLTAYVSRMYTVALGRKYDIKGLNNHTGRYLSGEKTAEEIAHSFIFSTEFKNKNLNNEQFVECMYKSLFGRNADAGGKSRWLTRMNSGYTREQVFRGFTTSAEFKNMVAKFGL